MRGAHNGRMRRRDSQEFGVKCLSKRRPGGGEGDYLNVGVILKWVNGYIRIKTARVCGDWRSADVLKTV